MNKYSKMVTICITSLNRGDYIRQSLESVLNQTYTNLEIVILDGGSTDDTLLILDEYLEDPRIKLFIDRESKGQVQATQSAYDKATGYYIGSVDSDDFIDPYCVEKCVDNIGNAGLIYTKCQWLGMGDRVDHRAKTPYTYGRLLNYFMTFHFRMFKRECWEQVRPLSVNKYCWDYDLSLKLSEVTDVVHIPEVLYYWRRHSEQVNNGTEWHQVREDYKLAQANARLRRNV